MCGAFRFWSNFWVTQNLGQSMLVSTLYCSGLLPLTNSGDQLWQWSLFMLKQYCLEGILAKESSTRTKDLLLWSDLLGNKCFKCKRAIKLVQVIFDISFLVRYRSPEPCEAVWHQWNMTFNRITCGRWSSLFFRPSHWRIPLLGCCRSLHFRRQWQPRFARMGDVLVNQGETSAASETILHLPLVANTCLLSIRTCVWREIIE